MFYTYSFRTKILRGVGARLTAVPSLFPKFLSALH